MMRPASFVLLLVHLTILSSACVGEGFDRWGTTEATVHLESPDGSLSDRRTYSVAVDGIREARVGVDDSVTVVVSRRSITRVTLEDIDPDCIVLGGEDRAVSSDDLRRGGIRFRVTCVDDEPVLDRVAVPSQGDWTERGIALSGGTSGWDDRISGAISPSTAIKTDEEYILYYIGADGDRSDGGPANRALGAARSSDGIHFERWERNPVLRHQPSAPDGVNVVEEGVFSAASAIRNGDGTIVLLFGGMESQGPLRVDGSGIVATSEDGFGFRIGETVISPSDPRTIGDDELFPIGLLEITPDVWVAYYIAKGGGYNWALAAAMGSGPERWTEHRVVLRGRDEQTRGGGDPIRLSNDEFLVPLQRDLSRDSTIIDYRIGRISRPHDLSRVADTHVFRNMVQFTMLLDREERRWYLYYLDGDEENIRVKTAPARPASRGVH